tara:strand:+ start:62 stop:571 length:510 start_codon:yes stop_codon:yes gene_type:complete
MSIIFIIHKIIEQPPFFFTQKRIGLNKSVIKIIKIKTMDGNKISKFSHFLRKTKLDEIPQLLSIIQGDLNFIGPRPLLLEYNDFYKKSEEIRFTIKPGITGLSQIKSSSSTSWDIRLRWDIIYVSKKSFKLDIFIFFNTIKLIYLNLFNKGDSSDNFVRLDEIRKSNDK